MSSYLSWQDVRRRIPHDDAEVARLSKEILSKSPLAPISDIRVALGITDQEIAQIIGVDQSDISRIEKGQLSNTETKTFHAYVQSLVEQVSPDTHNGSKSIVRSELEDKELARVEGEREKPRHH